jgi:hypothetical protein
MIFTASVPARKKRQEPLCGLPLATPTGYCGYITNNKKGKEPNTSSVFVYSWETWASLAGGLITGPTKRTFTGVRNKAIVRGMD